MKLSPRTIQILRNFSTINQSIVFKTGDVVVTISPQKTIMARAKIDSEIGRPFAVYDLSQFLAALSMFDDPEIVLGEKSLQIKKGSEKMTYVYSEPSLIQVPPEKAIQLPSKDIEFDLSSDELARTIKALSIIGAPEIAVSGDGEHIYLEAINSKDATKSTYRIEVGETDKTFQMIFLAENIKVLMVDYHITISARGLAHFSGGDIEYWIAVEQSSKFGE